MLSFTNFDEVLNMDDIRMTSYLDHLLLRLFNVKDSRTHFPVIIESKKNLFFTKQIFEIMNIREDYSYPAVELTG